MTKYSILNWKPGKMFMVFLAELEKGKEAIYHHSDFVAISRKHYDLLISKSEITIIETDGENI